MKSLKALIAIGAVLASTLSAASAAEKLKGVAPQRADGSPGVVAPAASFSPGRIEQSFVPIAPCRAFGNQVIAAEQKKNFQITGTGFTSQGGPSAGCDVPAYAKAVSINLTSSSSAAAGALTAYAAGAARPGTTSLSVPTTGPYGTAGSIVGLGSGQMSIYSSKQATVFGDITGYYVDNIEGLVAASGSVYSGSSAILSSVKNSAGNFTVTVDRDVTYCTPIAAPYVGPGLYASAYAFNGNKIQVYTWYLNNTGQPVNSDNSGYFYLTVRC